MEPVYSGHCLLKQAIGTNSTVNLSIVVNMPAYNSQLAYFTVKVQWNMSIVVTVKQYSDTVPQKFTR